MPRIDTKLMNTVVSVATLEASFHADPSPSFAIRCENTVTNAVERAPSAKRSRSKLGTRKAVIKASMPPPAPKSPAKITSLIRPSTRLSIIAPETIPAALVFSRSWLIEIECYKRKQLRCPYLFFVSRAYAIVACGALLSDPCSARRRRSIMATPIPCSGNDSA